MSKVLVIDTNKKPQNPIHPSLARQLLNNGKAAIFRKYPFTGYETREYLLEKWNRKCAYCDIKDVPLQIEHIHSRAKGGSNRISNLTLSCEKCNILQKNDQ